MAMSTTKDDPKLSFAHHLFFGDVAEDEVFPFPDELTADSRETLQLLLDPLSKFLERRGSVEYLCRRLETLDVEWNESQPAPSDR